MSESQTPKAPLAVLFITVLLGAIGLTIVLPVMPHLIMEVSGQDLSGAAMYGGLLLVSYSIVQFFFAPVLGALSDSYGRRRVLLVSLVVFALDYLVMAIAPTVAWLLLGRIIGGIAASTTSVANATIADISPPEERVQNFGLMRSAFFVGFIVGPVIGGFLVEFGVRAPFYVAAALGGVAYLFALVAFKESLPVENRRQFKIVRANPIGSIVSLRKYPPVVALVLIVFVFSLGQFSLSSTWAYFTLDKFAWTPRDVGYSLTLVGGLGVFVTGYLPRVLMPRMGAAAISYWGLSCAFVSYLGYAFSPVGWGLYVAIVVGAFSALAMLPASAIMTEKVPADRQGELQGALASTGALGAIIGPLAMLQVFGYFSQPAAVIYFPGAAFLLAAFLTLVTVIMLRSVFRQLGSEGVTGVYSR